MQYKNKTRPLAAILVFVGILALSAAAQDKTPIIIIPGVTGSELINSETGEVVWFKAPRSKVDDLRLPIVANPLRAKDHLVPGDILRSVKFGIFPRTDIYNGLIESLEKNGGYHEESWLKPTAAGGEAAIYVFAYDWRLDNVANARLLVHKIRDLRLKLKQPGLKFNVIAHSMGGIIARYAAMYGDADLPVGSRKPKPTWAGAKFFDKLILLGTPNEGSLEALDTMVHGYSVTGFNFSLPWVQYLSKFDLFTIPAAYQLLPAPGTFRVMDENFEPVAIDLYDPRQWTKYGWNAIDDKGFAKNFTASERKAARSFFAAALDRAKRLQEALAAESKSNGVEIDLIGSECKDSLDSIIVLRDPKKDEWRTLFRADGFTGRGGEKVTSEELKKLMYGPGDGVVTNRSFTAETESKLDGGSLLKPSSTTSVCEDHRKLPANAEIQAKILSIFGTAAR